MTNLQPMWLHVIEAIPYGLEQIVLLIQNDSLVEKLKHKINEYLLVLWMG